MNEQNERMAQANKNTASFHRFVETASLGALRTLCSSVSELANQAWVTSALAQLIGGVDAQTCASARRELSAGCCNLPTEAQARLEGDARRVIALAEGKGPTAIRVAERDLFKFDDAEGRLRAGFEEQTDDLGRAMFLLVRAPDLFEEAERFHYAEHYRNFGKLYEAFEVDCDHLADFEWNETSKAAFESKIKAQLQISGPCLIQYFQVGPTDEDGRSGSLHMFLIRHAGATNSVQNTLPDLSLQPIHYKPPVEATLLFQPDEKRIEVFAQESAERPLIAAAFAEVATGSDLSDRPMSLRQYNLERFYRSLHLSLAQVESLGILDVRVVEAEARPQNLKRRVVVKVDKDDDIETAAHAMLGDNNIFRRAALISRVVINMRFQREGKEVNLPITLSSPNRCNLASRQDPRDRELGYAVLEAFGIVRSVAPLDAANEGRQFGAMLRLYESDDADVTRAELAGWGADVDVLRAGGFLVPKSRASSVTRLRDDGTAFQAQVRSLDGRLVYDDPDTGHSNTVEPAEVERFDIKRDWLTERIVKGLRGAMRMGRTPRSGGPVIKLGTLVNGNEEVPVHLARRLDRMDAIAAVDSSLRGDGQAGWGVVLTATETCPEFVGANVVVQIGDILVTGVDGATVDQQRLMQILRDGRQRAAAAALPELRVTCDIVGKETATLIIPGKVPFSLVGGKQVLVVDRLLKAYLAGNPIVTGGALFEGMATKSPGALFSGETWKQYIGHPPDKSRGWMLLV